MMAIKDMQMPTSCEGCCFKVENLCLMDKDLGRVSETNRPDWCPLIDLSAWEDDGK